MDLERLNPEIVSMSGEHSPVSRCASLPGLSYTHKDSLLVDVTIPRRDTKSINVAMLSVHLKSLGASYICFNAATSGAEPATDHQSTSEWVT